jgi:hypothetical protein
MLGNSTGHYITLLNGQAGPQSTTHGSLRSIWQRHQGGYANLKRNKSEDEDEKDQVKDLTHNA